MLSLRIKRLLEKKGLKPADLARLSGIHQARISQILNNVNLNPRMPTMQKIARALNISVDELIGEIPSPRVRPLPIISKAVASPEGAYYTDQDFPAGAGEDYYEVDDPNAFVIRVEGSSMEPTIREADLIVITPSKTPKNGEIALVRLAASGKTFLKRVDIHGDNVILRSDNQAFETLVHKRKEIDWMYRVEAIVPR